MPNLAHSLIEVASLTRLFSTSTRQSYLNKVQIIGRLGADPTYRDWNNRKVVNYRVATSETKKNNEGEFIKKTHWHRVKNWQPPEWFSKIKKGDLVYVEGTLHFDDYTDKDGNSKTSADIYQTDFKLIRASDGESSLEEEKKNEK